MNFGHNIASSTSGIQHLINYRRWLRLKDLKQGQPNVK